MVLAKRSVNAHIRTKEQVLILTYNKALVNYIHDKINQVKENFSWSSFYIVNYHNFIKTIANNKGLRLHGITAFENEAFFKNCMIKRYKTIIIDEVQDYQPSWLRILKKDFLEENGELVVFGDEKQDIYERKSINKANTGIIFNRSKLNQNQRFSKKINNLLLLYQQYFFANKYDIDKIEIDLNQTINYEEYSEMVDYFNFKGIFNYEMIYKYINDFISKINVHPSDIAILSARVEILIELDFYIRKEKNEKTAVIFERKEIREKLKIDIEEHNKKTADNNKHRNLSEELDKVRDNKKQHFSMDDKVMKLSTIHSFKGWDIHTLFLIIENDVDTKLVTDELIYVGITRCKRNLIILNLGSTKYDNFFSLALKRI